MDNVPKRIFAFIACSHCRCKGNVSDAKVLEKAVRFWAERYLTLTAENRTRLENDIIVAQSDKRSSKNYKAGSSGVSLRNKFLSICRRSRSHSPYTTSIGRLKELESSYLEHPVPNYLETELQS